MPTASPAPAALPAYQESDWKTVEAEIIPGVRRKVKIANGRPQKFLVLRLLKNPNTGEYFTVPTEPYGPCVKFTADLTERLGLPMGRMTLKRLIYGGFIRAYRIAPHQMLVDLASLWEHIEATAVQAGEPSFWTRERRLNYTQCRTLT